MNDQIRELIVSLEPDAFMTYKGYLYHSGDPKVLEHSDPEPLYTQQELVKFAELLIRECVTKMALEIMDEQWVDDAVKNTYTHFGVEL
jgi:hypothetical protein